MLKPKKFGARIICSSLAAALLAAAPGSASAEELAELTEQETLNLVVTDSGLGGLSVVADIAERALESKSYRKVEVIFVNALFRPEAGYNSLQSREQKVDIFNRSLVAMKQRYEPDAILVGCNTLSVLLPDCDAATSTTIPVVGIVDVGVDIIARELATHPDATALLFATQTTVEEESHRRGLMEGGVPQDRFVVQACPNLTEYIERDPEGFDTELLISSFVSEALERREHPAGPVALSFNCTHFGYSRALWEAELERQGVSLTSTLNPNTELAAPLFPQELRGRHDETTVTVRAVSMIDLPAETVSALAPVLEKTSPETAQALRKWELVPDLFEWRSELEGSSKEPGQK